MVYILPAFRICGGVFGHFLSFRDKNIFSSVIHALIEPFALGRRISLAPNMGKLFKGRKMEFWEGWESFIFAPPGTPWEIPGESGQGKPLFWSDPIPRNSNLPNFTWKIHMFQPLHDDPLPCH
jgi:hypothetical protein